MCTAGGKIRARCLAGLLAAGALISAGCSATSERMVSTSERVVFRVATGFSNRATARTTDLVDIGMPDLYNQSAQTVTLRGVSLVAAPRSVHLLMVTGYLPTQGRNVLGFGLGNYVEHCRRQMRPYPLQSVVTPPHSDSKWYLVLSLTFAKPGRYYLGRVKIYYTAGEQDGWQYQNLYQTMNITLHNSKLPRFGGCL
jgi:hypothetical protein